MVIIQLISGGLQKPPYEHAEQSHTLAMIECQDVVSEPVISDQLSMSHLLGHGSQIIWWWVIPSPFLGEYLHHNYGHCVLYAFFN